MASGKPGWDRSAWLAIGGVLLAAHERTLTAPKIAAVLRAHPSNVKRDAEAMAEKGLLERRDPGKRKPGERGRGATTAYFLPDAGAEAVAAREVEPDTPGLVELGTQLVFAEAGQEQVTPLLETLAGDGAVAYASWFALCDGEPQEYAIAFVGEEAVESAADLMAELRGADLRARRTTITEVLPIERLMQRARRTARAARKARIARRTREAEAS
jgi:hypothetical protein